MGPTIFGFWTQFHFESTAGDVTIAHFLFEGSLENIGEFALRDSLAPAIDMYRCPHFPMFRLAEF